MGATNRFYISKGFESWLIETISEINKSIYSHAQKNSECEGMGTTIVIAIT